MKLNFKFFTAIGILGFLTSGCVHSETQNIPVTPDDIRLEVINFDSVSSNTTSESNDGEDLYIKQENVIMTKYGVPETEDKNIIMAKYAVPEIEDRNIMMLKYAVPNIDPEKVRKDKKVSKKKLINKPMPLYALPRLEDEKE